jgi:invasion protein IalB
MMAAQPKRGEFVTTFRLAALAAAAVAFSMAAVSAQAGADSANPAAATQSPSPSAAPNDRDPNQVICKRQDEIGTRLGGYKSCHTRAEWDKIARNGGDVVNAIQTNANHMSPSGR